MSAPRTKRQFAGAAADPAQRQITSFFTASSSPPPSSAPLQQHQPQSPNVPATVQTNLLSVGMRIRKSVPEGYKTGSAYSSFKLWSDADNGPVPVISTGDSPPSYKSSYSVSTGQKELLPFCGIHSIGGLSSQPSFGSSYDAQDRHGQTLDIMQDVPDIDDVPGLSSSQESVESNASAPTILPPLMTTNVSNPANRKRIFDDNESDIQDAQRLEVPSWADRQAWLESEVSPRSLAPVGWGNARVMAKPRGSARRKAAAAAAANGGASGDAAVAAADHAAAPSFEQENVTMDDFGEADFLVAEGMDTSDA